MKIIRIFCLPLLLGLLFACTSEDNVLPVDPLVLQDQDGAFRMADNPNQEFTALNIVTAMPDLISEPHQNKLLLSTTFYSHVSSDHPFMNGEMITWLKGLWSLDMTGPVTGDFVITLTDGSQWKGNVNGKRHKTDVSTWNWTGHFIGKGYGGEIDGMQILFTEKIESYELTPMIPVSTLTGKIIAR
jgi:hypothetical protein